MIRHHRATVVAVAVLAITGASIPAAGQESSAQGPSRGRFFLGGAFIASWTLGATEDPNGFGYLRPYFHGSLDQPAVGAMFNGGFLVGRQRRWSIGAEVSLRRARSGTISEDTRSKFEFWRLSSLYTEQEHLVSAVARWDAVRDGRVALQPMGGLTLSWSSQSLTNRNGVYEYYGGQLPISRPDLKVDATRLGLMVGADVLLALRHGTSLTLGARVHWVPRGETANSFNTEVPAIGPVVLQIAAGIRWSPGSR